jgi:hypothetical protein
MDTFTAYNEWRENNGMDRIDPVFTQAKNWGEEWEGLKTLRDIDKQSKPARQDNGRVSPGNDAGRSDWMPTQSDRTMVDANGRKYSVNSPGQGPYSHSAWGTSKGVNLPTSSPGSPYYSGFSNQNMSQECACTECLTMCTRWCRGLCCEFACCGYGKR